MQSTTNYGLNKPEGADIYDVNDFNKNMDKIDEELKKNKEIIKIIATPWVKFRSYEKGEIVSHNEIIYRCIELHSHIEPGIAVDTTLFWEEESLSKIVEEYKSELDYIIKPWNSNPSYKIGELVSHKGVVYKCIKNNSNVEPIIVGSGYWEFVYISNIIKDISDNIDKHQQKLDVIGEVTTITGEKISVQSNGSASTAVAEATFNKGIYLVVCSVNFPGGNTTGSRRINLLTTPNTISASPGVSSSSVPLGGITQSLQITTILNVTTDGTTYYLNAQQTSGSTLDDCQGQIRAVRIA